MLKKIKLPDGLKDGADFFVNEILILEENKSLCLCYSAEDRCGRWFYFNHNTGEILEE